MPEQQQGNADNSTDILWTVFLIIAIGIAIWYYGRTQIVNTILYIHLYEAMAIEYLLIPITKIIQHPKLLGLVNEMVGWRAYIKVSLGQSLQWNEVLSVANGVGGYAKYPMVLTTIGWAVWLYIKDPSNLFRNVYSTKTFRQVEKKIWPQITPVVNLDLVSKDINEGPWAMALPPMKYCKRHNLLDITKDNRGFAVKLRTGDAHNLLVLQLGPRWSGVDNLPMYLKALFAVFATRINEDKKGSEALLDQISGSAIELDPQKMDFTGVEELLSKHGKAKKVLNIIGRHAYITTVFASLLVGAREAGVLASSEFIWLKPLDRRMWYMLNTVGRSTAVAEICGAFSHWLAEKKLGIPLSVPMVGQGVRGLELAISEMVYIPEEE